MWRLVSEGLRLHRPVLAIAWSSTVAGIAVVFTVLVLAGVLPVDQALLGASATLPMYLLLASSISGWIAFGTDSTEKRLHLQLLLPIPIREVALARILLPVSMLAVGLPVAQLLNAAARALNDTPTPWLGHAKLVLIAALLFFFTVVGAAVQEVTALRERSRWLSLLAGAVVLLLVCQAAILVGWLPGGLLLRAALISGLGLLLAAAALALFCRRHRG